MQAVIVRPIHNSCLLLRRKSARQRRLTAIRRTLELDGLPLVEVPISLCPSDGAVAALPHIWKRDALHLAGLTLMKTKKCSRCSKTATLHITEIREGVVDVLHLCESCAHEYLASPEPKQTSDPLEGLSGKIKAAAGDRDLEELDRLECPNCGISFREFRNQGRLGCPHDYIAFRTELMPLLENIHGETQHTGKLPKRAPDDSRRQFQLIKLRSNLREAVDQENYEEAARMRDEIQELEQALEVELDTEATSSE